MLINSNTWVSESNIQINEWSLFKTRADLHQIYHILFKGSEISSCNIICPHLQYLQIRYWSFRMLVHNNTDTLTYNPDLGITLDSSYRSLSAFLQTMSIYFCQKFILQWNISLTWGPTTPPGPGGPVFPWKPWKRLQSLFIIWFIITHSLSIKAQVEKLLWVHLNEFSACIHNHRIWYITPLACI